jgi:hypothetical protein
MKKLYDKTQMLVTDLQIIANNISEHNPGLCSKKKVPLNVIQADIGNLARELATLYGEIGEKIKDDT